MAKKVGSALDRALADFEAKFDKTYGSGRLLTEEYERPYEVIPTGSLTLDYALGVGGYVRGRLTEIWGLDDVGKGTLSLQGAREAQRVIDDRLAGWIDMEHKWDWPWARIHHVQTARDRFKLIVPESAEEVADQVKDLCRSGLFSVIFLDSIGSMIPEAEKEKDADEAVVANQAKIVTRMVKIAAVEAYNNNVALVMLNQVRAKIGGYGDPNTTGGGFALKHCSTHKIRLKMGDKVKIGSQEVGHQVIAFTERNKVAPPKQRAEFTLFHTASSKYGPPGIDRADEAATMGIKTGVIEQGGAWYTMPITGERLNGRSKVVDGLRAEPGLIDEVRTLVLATVADRVITGEETKPNLDLEGHEGTGVFREASEVDRGE